MYTLVLVLTTFGWFTDDKVVTRIEGFKSIQMCQVAGEQFKEENTVQFVSKAKYNCMRTK
ncbi:hypothetical protein ADLP2_216 [Acinetobacter phage vB_AbaM_DLP2]|nr:hypothetical protein ADLP2_216 [Acinetobacter phage vB_AbaM_DLP2]